MRRSMMLMALALPVLLSACANGQPGTGAWQDGLKISEDPRINHPIVVAPSLRMVPLDTDHHGAVLADRGQLTGIVTDYARHGRGRMEVRGTPTAVRSALRGLMVAGMRANDLNPHVEHSGAGVMLSFPVATATPPKCGNFQIDMHRFGPLNPANSPTSDWGCASQNNLAAMLSDPADLEHRRGASPGTYSGYITGRVRDTQNYVTPPVPTVGK